MKAKDIVAKIYSERGLDRPHTNALDLVPINDLKIHKREVWSLSITHDPKAYFAAMDKKFQNRTAYYFRFLLKDLKEGLRLCEELSRDFGTSPCKMQLDQLNASDKIYLAVHIHPEFSFTPSNKWEPGTQEVVLNYF